MVILKILITSLIVYATLKISEYIEKNIMTEISSTRLDFLFGIRLIIIDSCGIFIFFQIIKYGEIFFEFLK